MSSCVSIVGAGELGGSLAKLLMKAGTCTIQQWDKDERKIQTKETLAETVRAAEIVLLCIPAASVREALQNIQASLPPATAVVSLAKGVDLARKQTMEEVLQSELPNGQPFGLLSGPMLAEEMEAGSLGAGVVGASDKKVYDRLREVFSPTQLWLVYSADVTGVAWAGVLKNIYALGLGMAQALELGDNFKGWYVSQAIQEMGDVIEQLGGKRETAFGLAGLGDLVATGFSPYSRNFQAGAEIASQGKYTYASEGIRSLPMVLERVSAGGTVLTLLLRLKRIVLEQEEARKIWAEIAQINN